MDELFIKAQALSNVETPTENHARLLKLHVEEVYSMIIDCYEENIMLAASRGATQAYLLIYRASAKVRDIIPLYDIIESNDILDKKFASYEIQPLMDRLCDKFKPFTIKHIKLLDSSEFKSSLNSDYDDCYCIIVEWLNIHPQDEYLMSNSEVNI